jgi:hypothetical protein
MDNFVVYAFCREDGTFYYIGKGRPERPYGKRKKGIRPPAQRERIIILHKNLPEGVAFDYEEKLILFYGRKDIGTGLLRNRTNGGEGASGWVPDEEWRKKKSADMAGERNPFFGKKHKPSTIEMQKQNRKGKCLGADNSMYGKKRPDVAERNRENLITGESHPMYGKSRPDLALRNKDNCPSKGTKWYNNGEIDKRYRPSDVPEGFVPGRLNTSRKKP